MCILGISGQYSKQKWPLCIQTSKVVHSLCNLPHFQIPLLQRSQRLPVLVSTCATTNNALKLLEWFLENLHTSFVNAPRFLVQVKNCRMAEFEDQVREFSAKLALVPIPPPGQLQVVSYFSKTLFENWSLVLVQCEYFPGNTRYNKIINFECPDI